MKKTFIKTILSIALFQLLVLPSVATPAMAMYAPHKANTYLGSIVTGNYTVYVQGDLETGLVSAVSVIVTSSGLDVNVTGIHNGAVYAENGVTYINIKVLISDAPGIIRVNGTLIN